MFSIIIYVSFVNDTTYFMLNIHRQHVYWGKHSVKYGLGQIIHAHLHDKLSSSLFRHVLPLT